MNESSFSVTFVNSVSNPIICYKKQPSFCEPTALPPPKKYKTAVSTTLNPLNCLPNRQSFPLPFSLGCLVAVGLKGDLKFRGYVQNRKISPGKETGFNAGFLFYVGI